MPPSPAQRQAQRQRQQKQKERDHRKKLGNQLEDLLRGLGLGGDFHFLIDKAIREDFSQTEFEVSLVHSKQFKRQFPGLVAGNEIAQLFKAAGQTTLGTAVKAYNQLVNSYQQTLRNFPGQKLTGGGIESLIRGQVSPEEFGSRVQAVRTAQANPTLLEELNREAKAAGLQPLDKVGFYKFIGRTAPAAFYDIYEAAQLRTAGLDISPEEALKAAGAIQGQGGIGTMGDVQNIIKQIRAIKPDIAPELARQGITDADLIALEAGVDTKGLEPILRSLVANRRSLGSPVFGSQLRRGPGGGLANQPDEGAFAPD